MYYYVWPSGKCKTLNPEKKLSSFCVGATNKIIKLYQGGKEYSVDKFFSFQNFIYTYLDIYDSLFNIYL